jgi:hypothetical protein
MRSTIVLLALVGLSLAPVSYADPPDELQLAQDGCGLAGLTFKLLAGEMNYDVDAMASQETREAFISRLMKWDNKHDFDTLKPTWLLSFSDALETVRKSHKLVSQATAKATNIDEGRKKSAMEFPFEYGATVLERACMFRAGKLAAQGRLLPSPK